MCAQKNSKTNWHEKGHIRMAIWLMIGIVTAAAFYEFSKLGTKFMNEKKGVQPKSSAPAASAPAAAPAAAPSSTASSGNP